jgi:phytol kinase
LTSYDWLGLILSYLYAFGLLGLAEAIRRWRGYPQHLTRKLVHIGAGMWVWAILALFDTWQIGLIPFATFIALNYVFYRFTTFQAMDTVDATPGTVYFALSITILYASFWRPERSTDGAAAATAAVMAMTWGDALASIIGSIWGRRPYTIWGHRRTWEGSAGMLLVTSAVVALTLLLLPGSSLSPNTAAMPVQKVLAMAMLAAVVATGAEGLSPAGTDNLSVPLLTGLTLWLLLKT